MNVCGKSKVAVCYITQYRTLEDLIGISKEASLDIAIFPYSADIRDMCPFFICRRTSQLQLGGSREIAFKFVIIECSLKIIEWNLVAVRKCNFSNAVSILK